MMTEHELLKRFEGTWDVETRFGKERGRGVCRARVDYGGFWLVREDAFETERGTGLGLLGFDPGRRAYVLLGLCSMGPGSLVAYGTAEGHGRALRFVGQWTDPASEASVRVQLVYELEGPDRITLRFQRDDGTQVGEVVYRRKPAQNDSVPGRFPLK